MTLQKKIVSIFMMLGAVFAIGSFAGLAAVVYPTFESFERESAEQNLLRHNKRLTLSWELWIFSAANTLSGIIHTTMFGA